MVEFKQLFIKIKGMIVHLLIQETMGYGVLISLYEKLQKEGWVQKIHICHDVKSLDIQNDMIIPMDVSANKTLFSQNAMQDIYFDMLDDKIDFYDYLSWNNHLLGKIKLIPCYDTTYNGRNIVKNFMIKDRKGFGSLKNKIKRDSIYSLIYNYTPQNQIQDLLNVKQTIAVDGFCRNGEIQSLFYSIQKGGLTFKDYKNTGFSMEYSTTFENQDMEIFIQGLLEQIHYTGFFQFEFVLNELDEMFILECNPRISGHVFTKNYYKYVILPFLTKDFGKILERGMDHFPPFWTEIPKLLGTIFCKLLNCF